MIDSAMRLLATACRPESGVQVLDIREIEHYMGDNRAKEMQRLLLGSQICGLIIGPLWESSFALRNYVLTELPSTLKWIGTTYSDWAFYTDEKGVDSAEKVLYDRI